MTVVQPPNNHVLRPLLLPSAKANGVCDAGAEFGGRLCQDGPGWQAEVKLNNVPAAEVWADAGWSRPVCSMTFQLLCGATLLYLCPVVGQPNSTWQLTSQSWPHSMMVDVPCMSPSQISPTLPVSPKL